MVKYGSGSIILPAGTHKLVRLYRKMNNVNLKSILEERLFEFEKMLKNETENYLQAVQ